MSAEHKFTPGPWKWVNVGGYFNLENEDGRRVCDDGSAGDEYQRTIDPQDDGESGANAKLIAAAPYLLSEMERYLVILERAESHPKIWAFITEGTGIATANGYRAAIKSAINPETPESSTSRE